VFLPVGVDRAVAGDELRLPTLDIVVDVDLLCAEGLGIARVDPRDRGADLVWLLTRVGQLGSQVQQGRGAGGGEGGRGVVQVAPRLALVHRTPLVPARVLRGRAGVERGPVGREERLFGYQALLAFLSVRPVFALGAEVF